MSADLTYNTLEALNSMKVSEGCLFSAKDMKELYKIKSRAYSLEYCHAVNKKTGYKECMI